MIDTESSDSSLTVRHDALLASVLEGIIFADEHGIVRFYNKACEHIFGYTAEQVVGQNIGILMPPAEAGQHDSHIQRFHHTGQQRILGTTREVMGKRQDGSLFPLELSVAEVAGDHPPGFVGVLRDLTTRKEIENELAERRAQLESILQNAPEAIVVINEYGMIESFSVAACRLFGYTSAEVLGRNVNILMPPPYHEALDSYLRRYLETGEKHLIGASRVVIGQHKSGKTFSLELSVGQTRVNGRRLFTGFLRDLTKQQETEHHLHELQAELLAVSRASSMGAMASAFAHELSQPMGAALNYLNAVRRLLHNHDHVPPQVFQGLSHAHAQIVRAGEIIQHLRQFIGKGRTERTHERLGKIIEEASTLAMIGAAGRSVKIHYQIDSSLPPVLMDRIQIEQVLINLIRNAVEAMSGLSQRELTIRARKLSETLAEVAVIDTGPGISPAIAKDLFKPFLTTKPKGMGIGLSICRWIIQAHEGEMFAEPNPAGGSIFRFTLPLKQKENPVHGGTV